jgi:hypothetical protein
MRRHLPSEAALPPHPISGATIRKLSAVLGARAILVVSARKPVFFLFVAVAVVVHAAQRRSWTGVRHFGWPQRTDWKAAPKGLLGADGEIVR